MVRYVCINKNKQTLLKFIAMRKIFSLILAIGISTFAFAESLRDWKIPIHISHVPSGVKNVFFKTHVEVSSATWYPYPYGATQMDTVNGFFSPKTPGDEPEYFEAEYEQNGHVLRKIYDRDGECKMKVEVKPISEAPQILLGHLKGADYKGLDIIGYETVTAMKYGSKPSHKFFLAEKEEIQVVYFNADYVLLKKIKWENHLINEADGTHTVVKTAYQGKREMVGIDKLAWEVRIVVEDDLKKADLLEFWEVEPIHIPEQRKMLEYHDLHLVSVYGVVYKNKKNKILKNTYTSKGELLETVEMVKLYDLPASIKKHTQDVKYQDWVFEKNVQKVTLSKDDFSYRFHATVNGVPYMMMIHSK